MVTLLCTNTLEFTLTAMSSLLSELFHVLLLSPVSLITTQHKIYLRVLHSTYAWDHALFVFLYIVWMFGVLPWLASLKEISPWFMFIRETENDRIPWFSLLLNSSGMWGFITFSYPLTVDEHLRCVCILATVNSPAISMEVQMSLQLTRFFLLDGYILIIVLDHMVVLLWILESPVLFQVIYILMQIRMQI